MKNERFSPSVHFGGILDNGFVFKLYIPVPNSKVEFNISTFLPQLRQKRDFMEKSENSKNKNMKFFQHFLAKNYVKSDNIYYFWIHRFFHEIVFLPELRQKS
jgi:hypothetical protein